MISLHSIDLQILVSRLRAHLWETDSSPTSMMPPGPRILAMTSVVARTCELYGALLAAAGGATGDNRAWLLACTHTVHVDLLVDLASMHGRVAACLR